MCFQPLILAAAHAHQSGLKFPKIDLEAIKNQTPKEFLFLPSDDDNCPSVLWFTLCNKKFKESYCGAKSTASPPSQFRFSGVVTQQNKILYQKV